jgi:hypothetical protein
MQTEAEKHDKNTNFGINLSGFEPSNIVSNIFIG